MFPFLTVRLEGKCLEAGRLGDVAFELFLQAFLDGGHGEGGGTAMRRNLVEITVGAGLKSGLFGWVGFHMEGELPTLALFPSKKSLSFSLKKKSW